jgi:hypothetical protein
LLTFTLFEKLVHAALQRRLVSMARGLWVLFFGLIRHSHIRVLLRADIIFDGDLILIYVWGSKTDLDGYYARIPGFRAEATKLIAGKSWTDKVFPDWSESDAVGFILREGGYRRVQGGHPLPPWQRCELLRGARCGGH